MTTPTPSITPPAPPAPPAPSPTPLLDTMNALSDETRLRLLRLLDTTELPVTALCDVLQLPQPTVSRHLKSLADARLVVSRRDGTNNLYRLVEAELTEPGRSLWRLARDQTTDWATSAQDRLRLEAYQSRHKSPAEAFFAGAAAEWDRLRTELYGPRFSVSALLALLDPATVLADLGCGTAPLTAQIAPFVKTVHAIDASPEMLDAARARVSDLTNVITHHADLGELPLPAASVNAAMLVLSLTYLADPPAALGEAARILKPGGRLVVVDLLPHARDDFRRQYGQLHLGFAQGTVTGWLSAAGLTTTGFTPLPPEAAVKGPALFLATARKPA